jgi:hypothetical protein
MGCIFDSSVFQLFDSRGAMQVKPPQKGQDEQMVGGIPAGQGVGVRLKIRGIYATALTRLLRDLGYVIADPSPEIQERISLMPSQEEPEILIQDREDHQGISVVGEGGKVSQLVGILQEQLLDAVLVELETGGGWGELREGSKGRADLVRAKLEFPGASKEILDHVRSFVVPTLARHHRLRIIDPEMVDRAEEELRGRPEWREELEENAFREAIWLPLQKKGLVRIEHAKVLGDPIRLREGLLLEAGAHRILIRRSFSGGQYDGLDLPIEEGDYALAEAQEGAWWVRHTYYSRDGRLKGEYYNINTPVELYPEGIRYVDLEVDLIRRGEETPFLIDRESLALLAARGMIGKPLQEKALEVAKGLNEGLGTGPIRP